MKEKQEKLPKVIKRKWLAALRSGQYKQGKSQLKSANIYTGETEYCCLGVLGEICGVGMRTSSYLMGIKGIEKVPRLMRGDKSAGTSPNIYDTPPVILASMNDSGKSFKEIANFIEKNY